MQDVDDFMIDLVISKEILKSLRLRNEYCLTCIDLPFFIVLTGSYEDLHGLGFADERTD